MSKHCEYMAGGFRKTIGMVLTLHEKDRITALQFHERMKAHVQFVRPQTEVKPVPDEVLTEIERESPNHVCVGETARALAERQPSASTSTSTPILSADQSTFSSAAALTYSKLRGLTQQLGVAQYHTYTAAAASDDTSGGAVTWSNVGTVVKDEQPRPESFWTLPQEMRELFQGLQTVWERAVDETALSMIQTEYLRMLLSPPESEGSECDEADSEEITPVDTAGASTGTQPPRNVPGNLQQATRSAWYTTSSDAGSELAVSTSGASTLAPESAVPPTASLLSEVPAMSSVRPERGYYSVRVPDSVKAPPVCFGAKPTPKPSTSFQSEDFERIVYADETFPDSANMTFTPLGIGLGPGQLEAWPEEQAASVEESPKMVDRVRELEFSTAGCLVLT